MSLLPGLLSKIRNLLNPEYHFTNKNLHEVISSSHVVDSEFDLDDNTCSDFLLDSFSGKFNRTKTSCGDELFDHWLRSIKSEDRVARIQSDVRLMRGRGEQKRIHEKLLGKMGKQNRGNLIENIWDGIHGHSRFVEIAPLILLFNALMLIVLALLFSRLFIFWLMFFLAVNISLFTLTNNTISRTAGSVFYFIKGLFYLERVEKKNLGFLSIPLPDFRPLRKIKAVVFFFKEGIGGASSQDILAILIDYLRVFLGFELLAYVFASRILKSHIKVIREGIYFIAYYDLIINISDIMEDHDCTFSELGTSESIDFADMYHPLIDDPVRQSYSLRNGMIVTGMNMAGKSTFMRSLGINQLLATSMGFSFARQFSTRILLIRSSFRIQDELLRKKSRYFAEAERLSFLMKQVKEHNCLLLIDEILSGTNTEERIYAAVKILQYFSQYKNSILVSATHDAEIAEQLKGSYHLTYFDGYVDGDNILFDYQLKDGIVSNRNGILILKALGMEGL